ncbi:MAG: DnaD domain protein [Lachnospiraceae bacterium]|nr:DnaD domain protein [Lachnospiraceae bacterium]MDY4969572.1 DnaD domain protein [Lachnospiraceae bacterium]
MSNLKVMETGTGYTLISNEFIDRYMITAGSSHLKTYLLLMRLLADPQKEISVSGMADILDCSESDVLRSLRHWEKKGLMQLKYEPGTRVLSEIVLLSPGQEGGSGALSGADFRDGRTQEYGTAVNQLQEQGTAVNPMPKNGTAVNPMRENEIVRNSQVQEELVISRAPDEKEDPLPPHQVDFASISADENFSRLLFIAEQYIGSPLSRADCESFAWMYDKLKMDVVLLEYLVESCVSNGHKSVRYMEAVAIDWHRKKIQTVEQARIYTPLHNKNLYAVMKALGLGGRQPAPSEKKIIDSWFQEYGFSLDMVVEACNRTMISIHEPNLNYVESILSRWKKAGISRLDQIQGLDEKFQKEKEESGKQAGGRGGTGRNKAGKNGGISGAAASAARPSGNRPGAQFHDFEQREYDYDELLKQINSMNKGPAN